MKEYSIVGNVIAMIDKFLVLSLSALYFPELSIT